MKVRLADIARQVGVHESTVSTVLNNSRSTVRISERTRQRILAAARELQYRPSFTARALAKGRTFSLGMICGGIQSPHFAEIASIALREAEARSYHLLISVTPWVTQENNLECLETLLQREVDGMICWGSGLGPGTDQYEYIVKERFPIVTCDEVVPGLASVRSDWRPGMDEAIRHLAERGHRRVRFVGVMDTDVKLAAFREACEEHGIEPSESYVDHAYRLDYAERLGGELARERGGVKAVMAISDYLAAGLSWGLRQSGVRIPQDVALVGMDGTTMGKYLEPSLTSIAQDRQAIVTAAIDLVLGMIERHEEAPRSVTVPTALLIREST